MVDGHRIRLALLWTAVIAAMAIIAAGFGLLFAGPAYNLYAVGDLQALRSQYPGGKAFVQNPELSEELEILRASDVFEIVLADRARKAIRLHPREMLPACGTPLVLTWLTNGLVPATIRTASIFSFTVEEGGVVSEYKYTLEVERRVSLVQHLYRPFRSDAHTLGAILASEYARSAARPEGEPNPGTPDAKDAKDRETAQTE